MHTPNTRQPLDIAFIQPPGWAVQNPPMGLALLKAVVEKEGYTSRIYDLNILLYNLRQREYKNAWELSNGYYTWERASYVQNLYSFYAPEILGFLYTVLASKPKVIGISVHCSTIISAGFLAGLLRRVAPEVQIVFGGPQVSPATSLWKELLESSVADAVIFGEGEVTLVEYLKNSDARYESPIKGCVYKSVKGGFVEGGERELIASLDDLPFPDYSDFDLSLYCGKNVLPTYFSRGCINKCIFCTERNYFPRFRNRSGRRVFEEVMYQMLRHPQVNTFRMHDSISNGSVSELHAFCDLITQHKVELTWNLENAVIRKEMTAEMYAKLRKAGCMLLGYGLENPSKTLLKSIGKTACLNADFEKVIVDGVKEGVTVGLNVMFGLPGETKEDHELLLDYLERLKKYKKNILINPALNFCYFPEGSEVRKNPGLYGVDVSGGEIYWEETLGHNTFIDRLNKFEHFCARAKQLGYKNIFGVVETLNKNEMLGKYAYVHGRYDESLAYLVRSFEKEMKTVELAEDILKIYDEIKKPADTIYDALVHFIKTNRCGSKTIDSITNRPSFIEYVTNQYTQHHIARAAILLRGIDEMSAALIFKKPKRFLKHMIFKIFRLYTPQWKLAHAVLASLHVCIVSELHITTIHQEESVHEK